MWINVKHAQGQCEKASALVQMFAAEPFPQSICPNSSSDLCPPTSTTKYMLEVAMLTGSVYKKYSQDRKEWFVDTRISLYYIDNFNELFL